MTPTESLLKELEELESKATPGPWLNAYPNACKFSPMPDHVWNTDKELIGKELEHADAALIATSRNSLPALLQIIDIQNKALKIYLTRPEGVLRPGDLAEYALSRCDEIAKGVKG